MEREALWISVVKTKYDSLREGVKIHEGVGSFL
jgi:hypothetical protein